MQSACHRATGLDGILEDHERFGGCPSQGEASFPVVKALVAADQDARQQILERIEIGARIDTRDVALLRKRLAMQS